MMITRRSLFTNVKRSIDLDITEEQLKCYKEGALIQTAFPNLTPDEREFFLTGITKEEWDEVFK